MRDSGEVLQSVFDGFIAPLKARQGFQLPRQQFIHVGALAYDCELFAVHAVNIYPGEPGIPRTGYQDSTGGFSFYSIDIGVSLVRESIVMDDAARIPNATDLTKASIVATNDASALVDAYNSAVAANSFADICDKVYYGGVVWVGPQGGFTGTMLNLSIQL